ncbi:MAG: hemolysin family protein [Anaerolineae bacterium]
MNDIVLDTLFIFALIIANGMLAMSEIAIVSARRTRLQQLADEGNARALTALELASDPTRFLATVQIGITLVGVLAGAFGGATLAEELAPHLNMIPLIDPHGESVALAIVVAGITYLSLVFGELVPKRLALNNAEEIASVVAIPMSMLSAVAAPIGWVLSVSTDGILRLLRARPSARSPVTPEEIELLIREGAESGVFEESEQDMIENVLQLDDLRVSAFMIPRTHIEWLDIEDPPETIRRTIAGSHQLCFPVARESLDNVLGVVQVKDLLDQCLAGGSLDLSASLQPPLLVPESLSALRALDRLRQRGTQIALVIDEHGGVEGMVTVDDLLEGVAGRFPVEGEPAGPQALQRADGSWLVDGLLPIVELKERLNIAQLPDEEQAMYQTVGGFVTARLGHIPTAGDHFDWEGLRFEVMDMDGRRVDKVLVTPRTPEERLEDAR